MKQLKRVLAFTFGALLLVSVAGGASAIEIREENYGVCSQLDGFAGLLQNAGLLATGTCGRRGDADEGDQCEGSCRVGNKKGKCRNTGKPRKAVVCSCVVNTSRED